MVMTSFVVTFLCSAACSAFTWYVAFHTGKSQGEMQGYGHTTHARMCHIRDLSNIHALLVGQEDVKAAGEYIRKANRAVESSPTVDQPLPQDI